MIDSLGWILVLIAITLLRGAVKGRGFDSFTDLGDLFTAAVSGDREGVKEVWDRGPNEDHAASDRGFGTTDISSSTNRGLALLAEMKRLGGSAKGYGWGKTGPDYYDCSGLLWKAGQNLQIWNVPRFTTGTFIAFATVSPTLKEVTTPAAGDIAWWPGHMGVLEDAGTTLFSALSSSSGIKDAPVTAISKQRHTTPKFFRVV